MIDKIDQIYNRLRKRNREYKKRTKKINKHTMRLKTLESMYSVVRKLSVDIQQSAHNVISSIVSECLAFAYDDPYEFEIDFWENRNKTSARFIFKRNGRSYDPLTECSGGMLDVACLGLRIAELLLSKKKKTKVLFLDEPFRYLDEKTPERISDLLKKMSDKYGVQLIMITHNRQLAAGKIVQL